MTGTTLYPDVSDPSLAKWGQWSSPAINPRISLPNINILLLKRP